MWLWLGHESFPNPGHWGLAKESLFQRWGFIPWKQRLLRTKIQAVHVEQKRDGQEGCRDLSLGYSGQQWMPGCVVGFRGSACGHPALNSTRRFCWRAALVASGEGQELWPSNLRDDPQIFWVLRHLPALSGHSFELPVPPSHRDPQGNCTNTTPRAASPPCFPSKETSARR